MEFQTSTLGGLGTITALAWCIGSKHDLGERVPICSFASAGSCSCGLVSFALSPAVPLLAGRTSLLGLVCEGGSGQPSLPGRDIQATTAQPKSLQLLLFISLYRTSLIYKIMFVHHPRAGPTNQLTPTVKPRSCLQPVLAQPGYIVRSGIQTSSQGLSSPSLIIDCDLGASNGLSKVYNSTDVMSQRNSKIVISTLQVYNLYLQQLFHGFGTAS